MARTRIVSRMLLLLILFGAAGLAVGYFIFARVGDEYINVVRILFPSNTGIQGLLDSVTGAVLGVDQIRTNILICGGAGAVVGLLLGLFLPRRR